MKSRSVFLRPFVLLGLAVSALSPTVASAQASPQLLPYMTSLVAGGGSLASFTVGQTCPTSGRTATDTAGNGCLATEVALQKPRFVTTDTAGNIYFSEYTTNTVRRIDASTGVLTRVAGGGGTTNSVNTSCTGSTNAEGDGCAGTAVFMYPAGLAVSPLTGELFIADTYNYTVRRLNLTTGVISLAAGTPRSSGFYIYNGTQYVAGTSARLYYPYGLQFDAAGNLAIAEEYKEAILVLNTSLATHTVAGVTIPAGSIAKVVGYYQSGTTTSAYCNTTNLAANTTGCSYGTWTDGASGNASFIDNPYGIAMDPSGNIYFANEYNNTTAKVDTTGKIYNWLGKQVSNSGIVNTRAVGNTLYIGSTFGVAADSNGNVYATDGLKGWVWRVDAGTQTAWVLAGAGTTCNGSSYGDGCPAAQTSFTPGVSTNGAYVTNATSAGLYGIYSDASDSLFVVDFLAGMIHKISNNASFGTILPTNPTQNLNIHFGVGDSAQSYTLTTNTQNFTLGSATCTVNSDTTTDCLLPVTANPPVAGPFSSNLTVTSTHGKTSVFTLSGVLTTHPVASTTTVVASITSTNPATPVTLTATVAPPTGTTVAVSGTVTFFDGSTQLGTAQTLVNGKASITQTFALGSHSITATYSGNLFLNASTSSAVTITSTTPDFSGVQSTANSLTVSQGQYATTSFTMSTVGLYTGKITFACSGLPANSTCVFSPNPLSVGNAANNDPANPVVALTIKTQSTTSAKLQASPFTRSTGVVLCLLPGFVLLGFGLRRKGMRLPSTLLLLLLSAAAMVSMTGCGSGITPLNPTPTGTYNVTVTATGTPSLTSGGANLVHTYPVTLTVTK